MAERKHIDIGVESIEDVHVFINEMDLLILIKIWWTTRSVIPRGGRIDLTVEQVQETAILQIKDSGPGISLEEHTRVFDPFYRSLGTDAAGSGLGLSIVKAMADRTGMRVLLSFSDETKKSGLCVSVHG